MSIGVTDLPRIPKEYLNEYYVVAQNSERARRYTSIQEIIDYVAEKSIEKIEQHFKTQGAMND